MNKKIYWYILLATIAITLSVLFYFLMNRKVKVVIKDSTHENISHTNWTNMFGIDISHYQGIIDWQALNQSEHEIKYIFIRATMGKDGRDLTFKINWKNAKKHHYIRGAYHYYRPNENSTQQFENYKAVVDLEEGDFVPILDIEVESIYGRDNLRAGVLNWLQLAEKEYGVKPMIYTGLHFYQFILEGYVDNYPLWIAAYTGRHRLQQVDWTFHQFSEKVKIKGIQGFVDGNDYSGDSIELYKMLK